MKRLDFGTDVAWDFFSVPLIMIEGSISSRVERAWNGVRQIWSKFGNVLTQNYTETFVELRARYRCFYNEICNYFYGNLMLGSVGKKLKERGCIWFFALISSQNSSRWINT